MSENTTIPETPDTWTFLSVTNGNVVLKTDDTISITDITTFNKEVTKHLTFKDLQWLPIATRWISANMKTFLVERPPTTLMRSDGVEFFIPWHYFLISDNSFIVMFRPMTLMKNSDTFGGFFMNNYIFERSVEAAFYTKTDPLSQKVFVAASLFKKRWLDGSYGFENDIIQTSETWSNLGEIQRSNLDGKENIVKNYKDLFGLYPFFIELDDLDLEVKNFLDLGADPISVDGLMKHFNTDEDKLTFYKFVRNIFERVGKNVS